MKASIFIVFLFLSSSVFAHQNQNVRCVFEAAANNGEEIIVNLDVEVAYGSSNIYSMENVKVSSVQTVNSQGKIDYIDAHFELVQFWVDYENRSADGDVSLSFKARQGTDYHLEVDSSKKAASVVDMTGASGSMEGNGTCYIPSGD